jgi:ribosomal-protein-alanine N-acetyltransferase
MSWPVTLTAGDVGLRPLRLRDRRTWIRLRRDSADWLQPWEATLPEHANRAVEVPASFPAMISNFRREARAGRALPWAVTFRGDLVGQVTVGGIALGSLRSAAVGYWIAQEFAGRGITPIAVAMALDYCVDHLGLHRIEINVRPENAPSLRVVEKLGLRREGVRERYLHIDGDWRDHLTYIYVAGDAPSGLLSRVSDTPVRDTARSNMYNR